MSEEQIVGVALCALLIVGAGVGGYGCKRATDVDLEAIRHGYSQIVPPGTSSPIWVKGTNANQSTN